MNQLEELALRRIIELSEEADYLIRQVNLKNSTNDIVKLSAEKDFYPINSKVSEIKRWTEAIINNKK